MQTLPVSEKIVSLTRIDLNLLTLFCLIYSVGSISRVADMLDISPSAVSQSLRKLREQMGDNLFVRSGNILLPTVYADELYDNILPIIDKLATLLPLSSQIKKRRLTLYTESFISPLVVPELTEKIVRMNSDISLLHRTADLNEAKITELLNMRQADVVFSTFSVESSNLSCQKMSDMTLVLIAAKDNPLYGDTVTEEMFREANLVGYNTKNEKIIYHRSIVDKKFRSSERCLLTTSFASILLIVSQTDCLGIIPEKVFSTYAGMYNLKKLDTPFTLPQFSIYSSFRKEMNKLLYSLLADFSVNNPT
ncbi:LysR family transcriptional regulator [Leclercia adecarboxylata]|uniref:LysR family transcriptional regulator n=1 Tax=Leclercia adecarboxylata TaxID=83655 RepID=UPI0011180223|nr:LysR family transcriptional regulator [Leclercia adecarboxylata]QCZ28590.1 LysR family transcriptional regulator [Leclercia adecarboxylata]